MGSHEKSALEKMSLFVNNLNKKGLPRMIVVLFFIMFFISGILLFRDYGISWDETVLRTYGIETSQLLLRQGQYSRSTDLETHYGPVLQAALAFLENQFNPESTQKVYQFRHFCYFMIFFLGACVFYFLCKEISSGPYLALLGVLMLVLNPRIFAEAFFNPKDIPCLVFFIISVYSLCRFLRQRNMYRLIIHGLVCWLLIGISVIGIYIPIITTIVILLGPKHNPLPQKAYSLILFWGVIGGLLYVSWPLLWVDPLQKIIHLLDITLHFPVPQWNVLYLGHPVRINALPWHYLPVWIMITIPLINILLCMLGCWSVIRGLFDKKSAGDLVFIEKIIFLAWLVGPLFLAIIIQPVLYNGWRHFYFIYPAIILMALIGVQYLLGIIDSQFTGGQRTFIRLTLPIMLILSLLSQAHKIILNRPFQYVYFNSLMGKGMKNAQYSFELDYWGISCKQALEYILQNDTRETIKVYCSNYLGNFNVEILPKNQRKRIQLVYREVSCKIKKTKALEAFIEKYPDNFVYRDYLEELVVFHQVSPSEVTELRYCLSEEDNADIMVENLEKKSRNIIPISQADYLIGNYFWDYAAQIIIPKDSSLQEYARKNKELFDFFPVGEPSARRYILVAKRELSSAEEERLLACTQDSKIRMSLVDLCKQTHKRIFKIFKVEDLVLTTIYKIS